MLSEEEKKAVEDIKLLSIGDFITWFNTDGIIKMGISAKTVLNLVAKLQKENKELKQENKRIKYISNNLFIDDYIPKKVIKDKIKEYKHKNFISMQVVMKHDEDALKIVNVLQELLESSDINE